MEHDPTAVEPGDPAEPSSFEEDPPKSFEPQVDLAPGQAGGVTEHQPDLIADAEAEEPDNQSENDGVAESQDDAYEGDDN